MAQEDLSRLSTLEDVVLLLEEILKRVDLLEAQDDEILERVELLEARMDAIHGASARPDEVSLSGETRRGGIHHRPQ
jgi:hypothetical protein